MRGTDQNIQNAFDKFGSISSMHRAEISEKLRHTIVRLASIPPPLLKDIQACIRSEGEWTHFYYTFEQNVKTNFGTDPKNTSCSIIPIFWTDKDYKEGAPITRYEFGHFSNKYKSFILQLFELLVDFRDYMIMKAVIACLPGKTNIPKHTDGSKLAILSRRIHFVIFSNGEVEMDLDNDVYNLKEGLVYEVCNIKSHAVRNNSSLNRIHIYMDILRKDLISNVVSNDVVHKDVRDLTFLTKSWTNASFSHKS